MTERDRRSVPGGVKIAAIALLVLAGREVVFKTLPALETGDPAALSEVINVAMLILIVWGLLTLQRWAWWLAVIASAAGWVIPSLFVGALNVPELAEALSQELPDRTLVVQQLALIGGASFVAFFALVTKATRDAFRS